MDEKNGLSGLVSQGELTRRHVLQLSALFGGSALLSSLLATMTTTGRVRAGSASSQDGEIADELVVGIDTDPVTLDPRSYSATQAYWMAQHMIEPLVFRDEQMQIIPLLATAWDLVEPTRLRFTLREGVTFHNEEPFTAESVKFTLESTLDESLSFVNPQRRGFLAAIDRVEVVDPLTVDIVTKYPSRPLLRNLASIAQMIPPSAASAAEAFGTNPVGTGPYRLAEYVPGSQLSMEEYDGYWGEKPATPRLTMRFIKEAGTRVAALQSGDVALINNVPPDSIEVLKSSSDLEVLNADSTRIVFFQLTYDRPPFNDRRVRAAINHAVDRQGIVDTIMQGYAEVARSVMAPSIPGFHDALPQDDYAFDPEKAQALLIEAGHGDGLTISFGYPTGRYLNDRQVAEAVIGQLEQVGIRCEPDSPEWGTYFSGVLNQQYDASMLAYASLPVDADWALNWLFNSTTSVMKYANPRVDELLLAGNEEFDAAAVNEIYKEAQALIWADIPWIPLFVQQEIVAFNRNLTGFAPRPDEYSLFFDAQLRQG